ncbi:MAG: polyprenyl synthetase family protein [bacterium]
MAEALQRFFSSSLKLLEGDMEAVLQQFDLPLYDFMRYHLGWKDEKGNWLNEKDRRKYGGKRIRPLLLLLMNKLFGGRWKLAVPASSAIEFLHNFSLIHDDIEDGDEIRRFRPTVWKIWGVPQAINLGSSMQALVNISALRLKENFPPETVNKVLEEISWAILRMTEGQYLDLKMQEDMDATVSDYLDMIRRKTGALFEHSCRIAGILANEDEEVIQRAGKFGMFFGLAFQIKDDYLGIWGKPERIGKPAEDIHKGKKSFPIVFALNKSEKREELARILQKRVKGEEEIREALRILEEVGAEGYTREICDSYVDDTVFHLSQLKGESSLKREIEKWVRESLRIS